MKKVVRGMKHCLKAAKRDSKTTCDGCPYANSLPVSTCFFAAFEDALNLIEKQERQIKKLMGN